MIVGTIKISPPSIVDIAIQKQGEKDRTWKLCLDYPALAKIEAETGIDVMRIDNWEKIRSGVEFPKIIHACLVTYSPDVTLDDVIATLNPEAQRLLSDALFELAFPGVAEQWVKNKAVA
jgi:hypothetical protein